MKAKILIYVLPALILTTGAQRSTLNASGSSLELINTGCDLFNPIFELRLLRHLRLYDPAVPTHGGITVGSEIVRYLRQRSIATTLHQIHRHLPRFILAAPYAAKDFLPPYVVLLHYLSARPAPDRPAPLAARSVDTPRASVVAGCLTRSMNASPPNIGLRRWPL